MRYSKWYSNQDKKLVLLIVIKEIKDQFKLPRPTNPKTTKPAKCGLCCIWGLVNCRPLHIPWSEACPRRGPQSIIMLRL